MQTSVLCNLCHSPSFLVFFPRHAHVCTFHVFVTVFLISSLSFFSSLSPIISIIPLKPNTSYQRKRFSAASAAIALFLISADAGESKLLELLLSVTGIILCSTVKLEDVRKYK